MRPDLPAKEDLFFGVFMNCGRGEREEFTFSCCFRISSADGTLLSSSMQESESWLSLTSSPVLPVGACFLIRDSPEMEGQLGDVGRTTFVASLMPRSRASVGNRILLPQGVQLPGGLVSVLMKHLRVRPFMSRFTLAWWQGLASLARLMA